MKLYLIRHGQTDENLRHLINDDIRRKVTLNAHGRKQADSAGRKLSRLKGGKIEALFVSPFLRTRQTADIINKHLHVPIVEDIRLHERKTGWDGKPNPDWEEFAGNKFFTIRPKGGESFQEEKKRTYSFLKGLKKRQYKAVAIISHCEPLQTMLVHLEGMSDKKAYSNFISNCQIVVADTDSLR